MCDSKSASFIALVYLAEAFSSRSTTRQDTSQSLRLLSRQQRTATISTLRPNTHDLRRSMLRNESKPLYDRKKDRFAGLLTSQIFATVIFFLANQAMIK